MIFAQLYSSSTGNLYVVTAANGKRLLIECGVTWKKLQAALNYKLGGIVGCLLTHEHLDHSKAIEDVMDAGIDVFASAGTFEALGIGLDTRRALLIKDKTVISCCSGFKIRAFATNHDAAEPLGFIIKCDGEFLLFATDTSYITQRFTWPFSIIAIGCSYNKAYLAKRVKSGDIHEEVAKRLLTSHMEEQETMRYVQQFCDISKCREIHLLHMSADNINKDRIKAEFEKKLFINTVTVEGIHNGREGKKLTKECAGRQGRT